MESENRHGRQCTCKLVPPSSLSSFTAAEYGDVSALTSRLSGSGKQLPVGSGGYTPLHYAAQHNHAAATAYLSKTFGNGSSSNSNDEEAVTPLHRAAYSGALSSMRVLLSHGNCNLLARDVTFGDEMRPLHKAVSGGRYLAVALLLDHAAHTPHTASAILFAKDAKGRTPLQLAQESLLHRDSASVGRWNAVAGGEPDWNKCAALLRNAHRKAAESTTAFLTKQDETFSLLPPIPDHLASPSLPNDATLECLHCSTTQPNDKCKNTASWETVFRTVLTDSVKKVLLHNEYDNSNDWMNHDVIVSNEKEKNQPEGERSSCDISLDGSTSQAEQKSNSNSPFDATKRQLEEKSSLDILFDATEDSPWLSTNHPSVPPMSTTTTQPIHSVTNIGNHDMPIRNKFCDSNDARTRETLGNVCTCGKRRLVFYRSNTKYGTLICNTCRKNEKSRNTIM